MNDEELADAWAALEPAGRRRRRIDARVFAWLEARDTPLVAEWLELSRAAPLTTFGLAAASTVAIAAVPPLAWFARALL
jgi:hypothetical protein